MLTNILLVCFTCFIVLYAIFVISDVIDLTKQLRFNRLLDRMISAIKRKDDAVGIICCPTINGPLASVEGFRAEAYVFTEIDMNGRERKIFVSRDCSNVEVYPWTKQKGERV